MIELSDQYAVLAAACVVGIAAVWGGSLSIRSIVRGPGWASGALRRSLLAGGVVAAAGLIAALFVRPVWLGLAVAYVGVVVAWLSWVVGRSLRRAAALGVTEPLPDERKAAVLDRLAKGLLGGGTAVAFIAIWLADAEAWVIGLLAVMAGALLIPGAVAHHQARRL